MEKKKYYISTQARTIMENQGDAAYELEIEATPEDLAKLRDLFEEVDDIDQASCIQGATAISTAASDDELNDGFDYYLHEVYALIYELGTEETKRHIEAMRILP